MDKETGRGPASDYREYSWEQSLRQKRQKRVMHIRSARMPPWREIKEKRPGDQGREPTRKKQNNSESITVQLRTSCTMKSKLEAWG